LPSPGAAAKTSVSPCGCRDARKRRSTAAISSSGVPVPTKPETETVSPSRRIAAASSGETILFFTAASSSLRYSCLPSHSAMPGPSRFCDRPPTNTPTGPPGRRSSVQSSVPRG
jgi:hypothetical protein